MTTPLTTAEIQASLAPLAGWAYERDALVKTFTFGNFREAMRFMVGQTPFQPDNHVTMEATTIHRQQLMKWPARHGFAQHWLNIYQVLASKQTRPGPTNLPLTREWMYQR